MANDQSYGQQNDNEMIGLFLSKRELIVILVMI